MNRSEWISRLERYRSDQARMEYLRKFIPLMEKKLAILRREAFAAIGARPDMSVLCGTDTSDPTARMGILAAEDALTADMRLCRGRFALQTGPKKCILYMEDENKGT